MTFAEKFCAAHGLSLNRYEEAVLRRALYPAARWLRPLLACRPTYFAADREFILGAANLRRLADFETIAQDYHHDAKNRGVLRRRFKLRVSTRRLQRLVRETLQPAADTLHRADLLASGRSS